MFTLLIHSTVYFFYLAKKKSQNEHKRCIHLSVLQLRNYYLNLSWGYEQKYYISSLTFNLYLPQSIVCLIFFFLHFLPYQRNSFLTHNNYAQYNRIMILCHASNGDATPQTHIILFVESAFSFHFHSIFIQMRNYITSTQMVSICYFFVYALRQSLSWVGLVWFG